MAGARVAADYQTQMGIPELLALADQVFEASSGVDQEIERIEKYCRAFREWHAYAQQNQTGAEPLPEEIERLQERHTAVLERLERLRLDLSKEMGGFHKRAKGIMAYTDVLPKRVSVAKGRTG